MVKVYSAEICPFAQRVRALLIRLGQPYELVDIDLSDRDPAFLALTPTSKVPLMQDGELKLYESQVINEYLAEKHGWDSAFSQELALRSRQRLAMKQWDGTVIRGWYRSVMEPENFIGPRLMRLERELDEMADTVKAIPGEVDNLLGIHCAPFWARMDWLREYSLVPPLLDARPALRDWLDAAARLPSIQETLPDREWAVRQYVARYTKLAGG